MTLEEAIERFISEQRTATNTAGENEIVVISHREKEYHIYVGKPSWKLGQEISSWPRLGPYPNLEGVKQRIAELSFASDIDPNGWFISPEKG